MFESYLKICKRNVPHVIMKWTHLKHYKFWIRILKKNINHMFSTLTDLCDSKEIYLNLHISISEKGIRKINLHFDITFNRIFRRTYCNNFSRVIKLNKRWKDECVLVLYSNKASQCSLSLTWLTTFTIFLI